MAHQFTVFCLAYIQAYVNRSMYTMHITSLVRFKNEKPGREKEAQCDIFKRPHRYNAYSSTHSDTTNMYAAKIVELI